MSAQQNAALSLPGPVESNSVRIRTTLLRIICIELTMLYSSVLTLLLLLGTDCLILLDIRVEVGSQCAILLEI